MVGWVDLFPESLRSRNFAMLYFVFGLSRYRFALPRQVVFGLWSLAFEFLAFGSSCLPVALSLLNVPLSPSLPVSFKCSLVAPSPYRPISPSPSRPIALSLYLPVAPSPCLQVSPSPYLPFSHSPLLPVSQSLLSPLLVVTRQAVPFSAPRPCLEIVFWSKNN